MASPKNWRKVETDKAVMRWSSTEKNRRVEIEESTGPMGYDVFERIHDPSTGEMFETIVAYKVRTLERARKDAVEWMRNHPYE